MQGPELSSVPVRCYVVARKSVPFLPDQEVLIETRNETYSTLVSISVSYDPSSSSCPTALIVQSYFARSFAIACQSTSR